MCITHLRISRWHHCQHLHHYIDPDPIGEWVWVAGVCEYREVLLGEGAAGDAGDVAEHVLLYHAMLALRGDGDGDEGVWVARGDGL